MNKVMIDTNVWVDIVLDRPQFVGESKGAVMACIEENVEMLVAATSLKDVFYFASKSAGADAGYRAVELILEIATLAQVDDIVCRLALSLERPDFEDGIVAACMMAEDADAIITRDDGSFNDLDKPKYTPGEYLTACGFSHVNY